MSLEPEIQVVNNSDVPAGPEPFVADIATTNSLRKLRNAVAATLASFATLNGQPYTDAIGRSVFESNQGYSCVECDDEIPPGRDGRRCKPCRNKSEPYAGIAVST